MRTIPMTMVALVFGLGQAEEVGPAATLQFERSLLLEKTAETSANVSVGDVNGDGHLDVVLVKGRHWPLVDLVLVGDGSGTFSPPHPLRSVADRSYSGVLLDIDTDGNLDVVVSNDYPDPKLLYLNEGKGEFTMGSTFGNPEWLTREVSVADLNGDGLPDIVVANRSGDPRADRLEIAVDRSGLNYVCFNEGEGHFSQDCVGFSGESTTTITPADFDGDGAIDLAVPHRDGGQSHIYLNDGRGSFTERVAFGPADATIRKAEAVDLNSDGILDLVTIDPRKGAAVYMGRRDGGFRVPQPLGDPASTPYALAVANLNGDGMVDVIVGHMEARPIAYFGSGDGGFFPVEFGNDQGRAYGFATGGLDEDGFTDIAMARSDAPNILYFGAPVTSR